MGIIFSHTLPAMIRSEVGTEMADESEMSSGSGVRSGTASAGNSTEESHDGKEFRDIEMMAFKEQLAIKREQRRAILVRHRSEKEALKKSLAAEQKARRDLSEENKSLRELLVKNNVDIDMSFQEREEFSIHDTIQNMREEFDVLRENNKRLRKELAESNLNLQGANSNITNLQYQNTEFMKQISALKEVVAVSKTMITLREQQLNELKEKLNQIEQSLADKEANLLSTNLRQEYERQLQNIRTLRTLYEERARLAEVTRLNLVRELEEQKSLNVAEVNKSKEFSDKITELELKLKNLTDLLEQKDDMISSYQNETSELKTEMSAINMLFSQVLLGFNSNQNLDTLVSRLKENHGILTQMAELENGSESSSALPKLLLQIVSQIEDHNIDDGKLDIESENHVAPIVGQKSCTNEENFEDESSSVNITPEEIVKNLPKVWKVLMELLSHQNGSESNDMEKPTTCYKSVETPSGPVLVPSVSQTYIRLKDLIVEKLALIKEVNRMKQLNVHLETRLQEQERRLCLVTSELSKTWHVVGRLRRHHHQLHTHEKILKYELQQKRKLLDELKEELEYCREKWEKAREKNSQSEKDWRKLRAEFTSRRGKVNSPLNNSGESGYSDERQSDSSDSNDESEYVDEPPIKCKKKSKRIMNIIDSSTEINLVAEREDPISDLMDVVDLPLDAQETEENSVPGNLQNDIEEASISESCENNNFSKNEKINDENEEELRDIAEESSMNSKTDKIDCDKCSLSNNVTIATTSKPDNDESITELVPHANFNQKELEAENDDKANKHIVIDKTVKRDKHEKHVIPNIDPVAILESIKKQNERLDKRDIKLENLERSSTALLHKTQCTVNISKQIDSTLDHLLNRPSTSVDFSEPLVADKHSNNVPTTMSPEDDVIPENNQSSDLKEVNSSETDTRANSTMAVPNNKSIDDDKTTCREMTNINESTDPSTSKLDTDHEARFAARDERLKRLEEQTKSLVNKVNNTKTKRIKLKYKLEELHNIYGSESSRAGTPSGETEDDDTNDDGSGDTDERND